MSLKQRKGADITLDERRKFKALYILIFSKSAEPETVSWVCELLSRSHFEGGAELLVEITDTKSHGKVIEIGAGIKRLLETAEALEITKEDKYGNMQEFSIVNLDNFLKPGLEIVNLLNTSEKQRVILEEIMNLRSMDRKKLTGYPDIQLFPGQSIIQVCKNNGIITDMFPLHEPTELDLIKKKWTFTKLPLGDIRNYFGEAISFYFSFICFYTWALLPPAVIGAIQTIISFDIGKSYVFFAIFKMIWLTIFLESWKRRSNELAYTWGTLKLTNIPKLHPTFRGKYMEIDPVTKQYVPVYPANWRHFKVYCLSLPLVVICLIFAIVVMFVYIDVEQKIISSFGDDSVVGWIIIQLPGIIYAVLIIVMNLMYSYVATVLTEWENHKTQESFDNHRIVKLLLFEFVNNFVLMGYTAFYLQDLKTLKWQIAVMMIVNSLINHFQEALLPYILHKIKNKFDTSKDPGLPSRLQAALKQREMLSYEGTYDDYLEMFMQFGYVFLFSSVFPLAALLAIFNNIIEIWMDGFKLCYSYQRPHARPAKGIGVWQVAFEVLGLLAVMSNCALISMSPVVRSYAPNMSLSSWILVAVVFEHAVIAVKMILTYLISDVPKWVKVAIEKAQYESLQILKLERKEKAKDVLSSLELKNVEKFE